jgi:hypothetical protein
MLAHIRRLTLAFYANGELTGAETEDLVKFVGMLDECLSAGGSYPRQWAQVVKTRPVTDLPGL